MQWKGKRVALVGAGRSNMAVARHLTRQGAAVTACDRASIEDLGARAHELQSLGVTLRTGPGYLQHLEDYDCLFVSPGVPKTVPELVRARETGVRITSEIGLFLELCRAPVIGITGSSGKTTTTTLVGELLRAGGYHTVIGGNIGTPLIELVESIPASAWVVLELSSFQLELINHSPHIAVMTNIAPDHLDVHGSMEAYVAAKSNILRFQQAADWAVLNAKDDAVRQMANLTAAQTLLFSSEEAVEQGSCLLDERVMLAQGGVLTEVCRVEEIRLKGRHNVENVLAAVATANIVGCRVETMHDVISSFTGVAHRLEFVRHIDGVDYYNDSIATTPFEAAAGLRAFDAPVVLIAGGYDKMLSFDPLAQAAVEKAKAVVLIGATRWKIAEAITEAAQAARKEAPQLRMAATLDEAVTTARKIACSGDVVLLSPACASFDMFRSFEERGNLFRQIVRELPTEEAARSAR